jgi:hypothetical protein
VDVLFPTTTCGKEGESVQNNFQTVGKSEDNGKNKTMSVTMQHMVQHRY